MRRFDLIVFDWDGTIVDSTAMIAGCIRSAASDLGLAVPTLEQASHVIGLGLLDALSHAVPGLATDRAEEFSARYRYHYLAGEPEIVLFEGMHAMLEDLQSSGVPLAVATGKTRRDWRGRSSPRGWGGSSRRRVALTNRNRSRTRRCCSISPRNSTSCRTEC